ncbi:MAG: 16S rRNA (uracil(1498)-N(3))-methyltransferase [Steroidobacteraceae bacterium]
MRDIRIFVPDLQARNNDGAIALPEQAAAHVARVLRLRVGDALTVFDGRGGEYSTEITSIAKREVTLRLGAHSPIERESPLAVTLIQGLARGEKMDYIIQKATELGVARIVPVSTVRSVVQLDDDRSDRKWQHWRAVAAAACEQCGRNRLPEILEPCSLDQLWRSNALPSLRLLLSPHAQSGIAGALIPKPADVAVLIGPEGGLDHNEEMRAYASGFRPVTLGPRVLRTETAGLAVLAAVQSLAGDLQ